MNNIINSFRVLFFVAVIAILFSCQKKTEEKPVETSATQQETKQETPPQANVTSSAVPIDKLGIYYFVGQLVNEQKGDTIRIQGQIIFNENNIVLGKYHYNTGSRSLSLAGDTDDSGNAVTLKEETTAGDYGFLMDFKPRTTGKWQLSINRAQGELTGQWTSADGKKTLKARLQTIAKQRKTTHEKYQVHASHFEFGAPEYAALNDTLARSLRERYESAIKGTEALIEEFKSGEDPSGGDPDYKIEERISQTDDVEIHHAEPDFVSYAIMNYSYTGGAHGSYGFDSFNKRKMPTGEWKDLKFTDVFKTGDAFSRHLSGLLFAGLKKQGASSAVQGTITAAEIAKNNISTEAITWFIRPAGITFVFGLYEMGAYVEGTPEVFVAWKSLKDFIKPDGFAARYISASASAAQ
jgi:hypothetical protein